MCFICYALLKILLSSRSSLCIPDANKSQATPYKLLSWFPQRGPVGVETLNPLLMGNLCWNSSDHRRRSMQFGYFIQNWLNLAVKGGHGMASCAMVQRFVCFTLLYCRLCFCIPCIYSLYYNHHYMACLYKHLSQKNDYVTNNLQISQ